MTAPHDPLVAPERIAGAPISWGVCEVPGWGVMLPVDRVLSEMRSLGITATELGAPGFLPRDPAALRKVLQRHGMQLIGGFVPLVLHDRDHREAAIAEARATAELFAAVGAEMFVTAVIAPDWSPRFELSSAQWDHLVGMLGEVDELCASRGLTQVVHPHVGALIETSDDVRMLLDRSPVRWCLDTGHLAVGGYDPAQFAADAADRVGHVHLKDVDLAVAADVADGRVTLQEGVRRGLFQRLGQGGAPIVATVATLEAAGYRGWYVLEQDEDLGPVEPDVDTGPLADVRASVEYLRSWSDLGSSISHNIIAGRGGRGSTIQGDT